MLVAAMNPCPCGIRGDLKHQCSCTRQSIQRYWSKISGPLLDRIDIHIEVPSIEWRDLTAVIDGESSETIRQRVNRARKIQLDRLGRAGLFSNSQMRSALLKKHCRLGSDSMKFLEKAVEKLGLSARAYHRISKIARKPSRTSQGQRTFNRRTWLKPSSIGPSTDDTINVSFTGPRIP